MRSKPVDTHVEVLELANAAYYVAQQHLHNHLHEGLGLDVLLLTGFCSAVRTAAFISVLKDRPEAFSLFSCGPQPLGTASIAAADDESAGHDDLMRMQLKISNLTTALSDKDIKKLTVIKHTIPWDILLELSKLLENFAGVTELVFGAASPLTSMLKGWIHFFDKIGRDTCLKLATARLRRRLRSQLSGMVHRAQDPAVLYGLRELQSHGPC